MKTKLRKVFAYTVVITMLFLSSAVYAEHPRGDSEGKEGHKEKMFEGLVEELGITPEQEAQIKKQRSDHKATSKELRKQLRAKHKELRGELEKDTADEGKINTLVAEIKTLMGTKLEQRVKSILFMKETLTQEQFTKLREKKEKHKSKMMKQCGHKRSKYHHGQDDEPSGL